MIIKSERDIYGLAWVNYEGKIYRDGRPFGY